MANSEWQIAKEKRQAQRHKVKEKEKRQDNSKRLDKDKNRHKGTETTVISQQINNSYKLLVISYELTTTTKTTTVIS